MTPNEIRNLTVDEIRQEINERREKLLDLRFQASVGQASNPRLIRSYKRDIARLLTIASESSETSEPQTEQPDADQQNKEKTQ